MLAGKIHEMKVERQTPLGYTLTLDGEEYFLHQAEVTRPLEGRPNGRGICLLRFKETFNSHHA